MTTILEAARATCVLLVNGSGYASLNARTIVKKKRPIAIEERTATSIDNLAALGLPAPSSLEILTLEMPMQNDESMICIGSHI